MSHRDVNYQTLPDRELVHIIINGPYGYDRNRAWEEIERRRQASVASNPYIQQLETLINNINTRVQNQAYMDEQIAAAVRQINLDISDMKDDHQRVVNRIRADFSRRIEDLDRDNQQRLRKLAGEMGDIKNKLQMEIQDQGQRMQQHIDSVENNLTARINNVTEVMQDQINQVNLNVQMLEGRLNAIDQNAATLDQQARAYLETAENIISEVDLFNTHHWRSDDRRALTRSRNGIVDDLNNGGMLALGNARSSARALFEQALIFQQQVIADERQWQLEYELTDEVIAEAEVFLEENERIIAKTREGETEIDVDHWTCGDLSRIRNGLETIRDRLGAPDLTNEQMFALRELVSVYREQTAQAVTYAIQAAQLSRGRKQLMDRAIDLLTKPPLGFMTCEWREFCNKDPRLGYRAYLVDRDGTRVVITAELLNQEGNPENIFRSEILSYGNNIHDTQQAAAYNRDLTRRLSEGTRAQFGQPECQEQQNVIPDTGLSSQTMWMQPETALVDTILQNVGYQSAPEIQRQIETLRQQARA